jgi:hypothetical protein
VDKRHTRLEHLRTHHPSVTSKREWPVRNPGVHESVSHHVLGRRRTRTSCAADRQWWHRNEVAKPLPRQNFSGHAIAKLIH